MKTKKFLNRLLCAVSAVSLTICMADMPVKSAENEFSEIENQLIELINNERAKEELTPLKVLPYLNEIAEQRAEESIIEFSHSRPDGSNYSTIIDDNIFEYGKVYELLFKSENSSAEKAFEEWNSLKAHREAFMSDEMEYIGVGLVYDENSETGWHWQVITGNSYKDYDTPSGEVPDFSGVELSETESQLIELINNERKKEGLSPLENHPYLNEIAGKRAEEITVDYSHIRPDGTDFSSMIDNKKLICKSGYELIANPEKYTSVEELFSQLNSSESYRNNMLSENLTNIGVGIVYGENGLYFDIVMIQSGEKEDDKPVTPPEEVDISEVKNQLVTLINDKRAENNLKPLEMHSYLNEVADKRAEEITVEFSHDRPDGSSFSTVIDNNIFTYDAVYERLLKSEDASAEDAFKAWNVPGQSEVFMADDVEYIGVGLIYDESSETGWHWVIMTSQKCNEVPAGDANGDGKLGIADAVLIMQVLSNSEEFMIQEEYIDSADVVNKGDGITVMDALAIQMVDINLLSAEDLPITSEELDAKIK